ncbi:MAG: Capsular glucan synthase [Candidatus Latescibacteria bacterium ADurb.Bin168]|nr:MAG: Capsular glucan synthase [Candidatus Latescibacteria bacterium ADurb.Bin168]
MNVLMLHNYYQQRGGEDASAEQDVALLRSHGHAVHFHPVHNDEIKDYSQYEKGALWFAPTWSRRSYRDVKSLIRGHKPDVVHVQNFFPLLSPSVLYACREAGVPVVQTLRNYRLLAPCALLMRENRVCERCIDGGLWNSIRYRCYHGSALQTASIATMIATHRWLGTWDSMVDRYVALTEFSKNVFMRGGLFESRIVVRPNFLMHDPGTGYERRSGAVFVGRLSPEKGVVCLLEAWRALSEIPLTIIGDGPLAVWCADSVRVHSMRQVKLAGAKPSAETFEAIKRALFLVSPSVCYETFGRTIIEAFATGTPVLVSDIGAGASLVSDSVTGLHFEAGNAADLAKKAREMVSDPDRLGTWGEAARREYPEKYTSEVAYGSLMRVYGDVTGGGRSSSPPGLRG